MGTATLPTASASPTATRVVLEPTVRAAPRVAPRSIVLPIHPRWKLVGKRAIDVLGALAGLVVTGPVLLAVAAWIRLDSSGPALFGHERVGLGGRRFRCLKFRTMRPDAEEVLQADPRLYQRYVSHNYKLPIDEDPRVTRAGRFLRRTSLDELPQLVNVLRGEMSLVGPRPIVPAELEQYGSHAAVLLSMRPGMTGQWAANGRSRVGYPTRAWMELEYVARWSLWRDLRLLARTASGALAVGDERR